MNQINVWKEWFAWYPVIANVILDINAPYFSIIYGWDGKPGKKIVWLRTVYWKKINNKIKYKCYARPETREEWADMQW